MRRRLLAAFGVACVFAGACLLDIPDVKDGVDGASGDVVVPDVAVPTCDGSCAPAGFAPVLFALDQNTACPATMTTLDLVADPGAVPASACKCNCTVTQLPSCIPTTITHWLDQGAAPDGGYTCAQLGTLDIVGDGGCNWVDGGFVLAPAWKIPTVPPAAQGTCTSVAANDPSGIPSTPSRLCVDPSCTGACTAPPGLLACVYASGAIACPAGYGKAHHVGSLGLACDPCTGCTATAASCGGTVTFYNDDVCTNLVKTLNVDGGCATTGLGAPINSVRYNPALNGIACTPGSGGPGSATLAGEYTVCCP